MKNIFKPYSILSHILSLILFFFFGVLFAKCVNAGKGQMLAGGAIVFSYGLMGAFIGLCLSLFGSYRLNKKRMIRLNLISTILIIGIFGYFYISYQKRQKEKNEEQKIEQIKRTTVPQAKKETALLFSTRIKLDHKPIGLGVFTPHLNKNTALYFYNNPNLEKSVQDHLPNDSITFKKSKYGITDIVTAPAWLVPEHLKLDYDILHFKVLSVTSEYYEIIVNTITHKTSYVDKNSGVFLYWPEFLLQINSVEFLSPNMQKVFIKPVNHASHINTKFSFMKPVRIQSNWMQVILLDDNFNTLDTGWIQWKKEGQLLISYSLLS